MMAPAKEMDGPKAERREQLCRHGRYGAKAVAPARL